MQYQEMYTPDDAEQNGSNGRMTADKKLTTGEYCRLLRQQYERLAQHQQVIEAEWRANNIH
jgi:hypothetical protein